MHDRVQFNFLSKVSWLFFISAILTKQVNAQLRQASTTEGIDSNNDVNIYYVAGALFVGIAVICCIICACKQFGGRAQSASKSRSDYLKESFLKTSNDLIKMRCTYIQTVFKALGIIPGIPGVLILDIDETVITSKSFDDHFSLGNLRGDYTLPSNKARINFDWPSDPNNAYYLLYKDKFSDIIGKFHNAGYAIVFVTHADYDRTMAESIMKEYGLFDVPFVYINNDRLVSCFYSVTDECGSKGLVVKAIIDVMRPGQVMFVDDLEGNINDVREKAEDYSGLKLIRANHNDGDKYVKTLQEEAGLIATQTPGATV